MLLSELTAYAEEQFHIREQHKWAEFPGFSVLSDPGGKWFALLLRQWDPETGEEIERCDLRCAPLSPAERALPWLTAPFRMKGPKWAGLIPARCDDPERAFRLLDRAILPFARGGFTLVLDGAPAGGAERRIFPLPPHVQRGFSVPEERSFTATPIPERRAALPESDAASPDRTTDSAQPPRAVIPGEAEGSFQFTLFSDNAPSAPRSDPDELPQLAGVPETLRRMISLYKYGDSSNRQKAKNFYLQGKCAEDYEDDAPWDLSLHRYYPVYHDLNIRQLRGYFSWRSALRRGTYRPAPAAYAYLYLYELLNGIGADSPADALEQMQRFEAGYLDAGLGDGAMRGNLRRWARDLCILSGLPPETARSYADPDTLARDAALNALREPEEQPDGVILAALLAFGDPKLSESPVLAADPDRGAALFAAAWRRASADWHGPEGQTLFERVFGRRRSVAWYPLSNAVYYEPERHPDADYALDPCRSYQCRGGLWREWRYEAPNMDQELLRGFLHEAERQFRRYLKAGRALRPRETEAWAAPYAEAAVEQDRRAALEAARPRVRIDLSGLERIRRDALRTRDSLLTEEELAELRRAEAEPEQTPDAEEAPAPPDPAAEASPFGLDALQLRAVRALLRGEDAGAIVRSAHRLPSVLADGVNEVLFDEIGDSVLDCDGDTLSLVEDYREDLQRMLGGT